MPGDFGFGPGLDSSFGSLRKPDSKSRTQTKLSSLINPGSRCITKSKASRLPNRRCQIRYQKELISPENFGPGSTHSTFASNTLGTVAGLEVMKILGEGQWEKTNNEKGVYFLKLLKDLQSRHPEIGDVHGIGLALRMEMCETDGFTPDRELADKMFQRGLEGDLLVNNRKLGIVLDIGGYYKNVVTVAPSFHITYEEMDLAHEILGPLLSECK